MAARLANAAAAAYGRGRNAARSNQPIAAIAAIRPASCTNAQAAIIGPHATTHGQPIAHPCRRQSRVARQPLGANVIRRWQAMTDRHFSGDNCHAAAITNTIGTRSRRSAMGSHATSTVTTIPNRIQMEM